MTKKATTTRVYREANGEAGADGIQRSELPEKAEEKLFELYQHSELVLDTRRAIRAVLMRVDERDGKSADRFLRRMSVDEMPLFGEELDVMVTPGGGLRKLWPDVAAKDIASMVRVRLENYKASEASFIESVSTEDAVMEALKAHKTVGAAVSAGAFASSREEVAA